MISGFKEYYDRSCPIGLDIDAGPILFGLSLSGTAFATGAVTYFGDNYVRTKILRTAEKAGHTILWNGKRHYALANIAIVGEAIMLAMRTHYKLVNTDDTALMKYEKKFMQKAGSIMYKVFTFKKEHGRCGLCSRA